ncbi:MAG TPA: DivIVA domain-containing protein [Acidimicrobiales bacterium]
MASDRDVTTSGAVLSADAIATRAFSQARRGYDTDEVRRFLQAVAQEIAGLRRQTSALESRLKSTEERVASPDLSEEAIVAAVGDEMAATLRSAHSAATELRKRTAEEAETLLDASRQRAQHDMSEAARHLAEARTEAQRLLVETKEATERQRSEAKTETEGQLSSATTEAAKRRADAQEEAGRLVSEASVEAERRVTELTADAEAAAAAARRDATSEGQQIIGKARADAEIVRQQTEQERSEIIETAQALRERVLADLARRRRVATIQVEQLRAGRERLIESYGVVRRTLEEVQDELQRADAEARAAADETGRRYEDQPEEVLGQVTTDSLPAAPTVAPPIVASPTAGADPGSAGPAAADRPSPAPEKASSVPSRPGRDAPDRVRVVTVGAPERQGDSGSAPAGAAGSARTSLADRSPAGVGRLRVVTGTGGAAAAAEGDQSPQDPGEGAELTVVGDGPSEGDAASPGQTASQGEAASPDDTASDDTASDETAAHDDGSAGNNTDGDDTSSDDTSSDDVVGAEGASTDAVGSLFDRIRSSRKQANKAPVASAADSQAADSQAGDSQAGDSEAAEADVVGATVGGATAGGATAGGATVGGATAGGATVGDAVGAGAADAAAATDADAHASDATAARHNDDPDGVVHSDADEALLQQREAALSRLERDLGRRFKRALQDEQNDLLDRLRGAKGTPKPEDMLPEPAAQLEHYASAAHDVLTKAATAGSDAARQRLALTGDDGRGLGAEAIGEIARLAADRIVEPLRRRVTEIFVDQGADGSETLTESIGSVYRSTRGQRVEPIAADALSSVFAVATWHAVADGTSLRWISDDADGPCPDCDDNALAGPLVKGETFPTGQLHPPAHDGCRCLLVPEPG